MALEPVSRQVAKMSDLSRELNFFALVCLIFSLMDSLSGISLLVLAAPVFLASGVVFLSLQVYFQLREMRPIDWRNEW